MSSDLLIVVGQFRPMVGGAERQAERLAGALQRAGHRVEIATRLLEAGHPREERLDGVPIKRLGFAARSAMRIRKVERATFAFRLWRELARNPATRPVLVQHLLYPALVAGFARGTGRWPLILRVSSTGATSDFEAWGLFSSLVHRYLRTRVAALVVLNEEGRREAVAKGYAAGRIVVIPNGVEVGNPPAPRPAGRPTRVLHVGGLRAEKRLDILLSAWRQAGAPGELTLVGDGPERGRLEALASGLGLRVAFAGNIEEPGVMQRDADILVLSSDAEGMSNALLEGMAAGCACVATYVGGNIDCLAPGASEPASGEWTSGPFGWLVRRGDAAALGRALLKLCEEREIRDRLGRAARERACSEYALPRVASLYADLLARVGDPQEFGLR